MPRRREPASDITRAGAISLVRAFLEDARVTLSRAPARAFLVLEAIAAAYLVVRRGPAMVPLLAVIAVGALACGFLGWTAGRMRGARSAHDVVRAPRAEMAVVATAYLALSGWLLGWWPGQPLPSANVVLQAALAAWVAVAAVAWLRDALRSRPTLSELAWLPRSWRPLWPLVLALAAVKLPLEGGALVGTTAAALASGMTQQVLLQVGLTARLEAVLHRPDAAAVLAAVGFGAAHIAMNLPQAGGDWWIATANAVVLQTTIGLVACTAYLRHRAPLAVGLCHALLMA